MGEQREVLRYELDITDVESKTRKMEELLVQLKARRAAGEDVSELEAQISREAEGLTNVTAAWRRCGNATEDVIRQKDKLAQTVSLLGGRFGGLVGQLGSVAELLVSAGRAAIGFGVALASITGVITLYQHLKHEIAGAVEQQEKLNEAQRQGKREQMGTAATMAEGLAAWGAGGRADEEASWDMRRELMRQYGFNPEQARRAAEIATAAGIGSPEEAAVLSELMRSGAQVTSREDAQRAMAAAQEGGEYARALKVIEKRGQGEAARQYKVQGELMAPNAPHLTPEELLYEGLVAVGKIDPEEMPFEEFRKGVGNAEHAEERLGKLRRQRAAVAAEGGPNAVGEAVELGKQIKRVQEDREKYGAWAKHLEHLRDRDLKLKPPLEPGETQPEGATGFSPGDMEDFNRRLHPPKETRQPEPATERGYGQQRRRTSQPSPESAATPTGNNYYYIGSQYNGRGPVRPSLRARLGNSTRDLRRRIG